MPTLGKEQGAGAFLSSTEHNRKSEMRENLSSATCHRLPAKGVASYEAVSHAGKDYESVVQIENNVIELLPQAAPLSAIGVVTSGGADFRPNYIVQQVAIRDNLMRYPDNLPDFPQWSVGTVCNNCGVLLMENNIIALSRDPSILFNYTGMASCVNNRAPNGALLKADDLAAEPIPFDSTNRLVDAYFPAAEDAFVMAF